MRICLRNKDFDEIRRIGSFWVKDMKNLKNFENFFCKQTCCCLFTFLTFLFTEWFWPNSGIMLLLGQNLEKYKFGSFLHLEWCLLTFLSIPNSIIWFVCLYCTFGKLDWNYTLKSVWNGAWPPVVGAWRRTRQQNNVKKSSN